MYLELGLWIVSSWVSYPGSGGDENLHELTFWLCHDPGLILLKCARLLLNYAAIE